MRNKSSNDKNGKKDNSFSPKNKSEAQKLYRDSKKQQPLKLTKEDYLYSFPTCDEGSCDEIYLDEIVVYYSFN